MAKVSGGNLTPKQIAAIEKDPWLALHPSLPHRYIVYVSGRGTGKSYKISDALLWYAHKYAAIRVLVAREKADSNSESVKEELRQHVRRRQMGKVMREANGAFVHSNGSKMIFKGLNESAGSHKAAKSTAQIDLVFVEESQEIGEQAWQIFLPTIRKRGAKIIIAGNPELEDSYLATRWIDNPDEQTILVRLFKEDNPAFPESLVQEMAHDQKMIDKAPNEDARRAAQAIFDWKWLGAYKVVTDKQVLKRVEVKDFDTPEGVQFFHGMDHGFASDPACVIRCFIMRNEDGLEDLYVDFASYGHGISVHDLGTFVGSCPTLTRYGQTSGHVPKWEVKADSARPELNSMLNDEGFDLKPVEKWDGSVEDGILYLNSFDRIYVRPELEEFIDETKKYSYKVDRITGKPLPILEDKFNHGIDGLRYALQDRIKNARAGFFDMPTTETESEAFGSGVGFY